MSIMEQKMQEMYEGAEHAQEQLFLSSVRLSLDFAEWIDIHGIRDGQHEWKYKADNYKKKFSTQEMFDEWQKVTTLNKLLH